MSEPIENNETLEDILSEIKRMREDLLAVGTFLSDIGDKAADIENRIFYKLKSNVLSQLQDTSKQYSDDAEKFGKQLSDCAEKLGTQLADRLGSSAQSSNHGTVLDNWAYADPTYTKPTNILLGDIAVSTSSWVILYLELLKLLFEINPEKFIELPTAGISGTKRNYFSHDKIGMNKPEYVCDAFYVETNFNGKLVLEVARRLFDYFSLDYRELKIFIRTDYNPIKKGRIIRKGTAATIALEIKEEFSDTDVKEILKWTNDSNVE